MTVHRRTYQPYRGDIAPWQTRFWCIASREVRLAWHRKWVRRLMLLSLLPMFIALMVLYVELMIKKTLNMDLWGGEVFTGMYKAQALFVVLVMAAAGSDLIAKDVSANAHPLYFARPLGVGQYLAGKLLAIAILLGAITIGPGVVLDIGQLVLAGEADVTAFLFKLGQIGLYGILLSSAGAAIIGCLSSFGKRARYVGLAWVALYFVSNAVSLALVQVTRSDVWREVVSVFSVQTLFVDSGRFLYASDRPALWSLVGLVVLGGLSAWILYLRIAALQRKET